MSAQTARVRALAGAGMSDAQIGLKLGVHGRTVLRWRQAAGIPSSWSPAPAEHGTHSRYKAGCRCDQCRAANVEASRRARAGLQDQTKDAPRHFQRWTPAEDHTVQTMPARAAAEALGRTYCAVTARRGVLARRNEGAA